jgi:hypothetical protein
MSSLHTIIHIGDNKYITVDKVYHLGYLAVKIPNKPDATDTAPKVKVII